MELKKTSSADRLIGTMAEKLGAVAKAATVFGGHGGPPVQFVPQRSLLLRF